MTLRVIGIDRTPHNMKKTILSILILVGLVACGGRIPSPQTAQGIIRKHLDHYGKKYADTLLSGHKVSKVEIINIEEIQKDLATAQAMVSLDNGTELKIQMNFLHKLPLGWRQQGWEILEPTPVASP